MGERIYSYFNQPAGMILPEEIYIILFALVWLNIVTEEAQIEQTRDLLLKRWQEIDTRSFFQSIIKAESFNDLLRKVRENKDKILIP